MSPSPTPAELGYRMPAEWEPRRATWLAWPHNLETWPGGYEPIPAAFARFVERVAASEPVHVLAGGAAAATDAARWLGELPKVTLHDVATNDAWIRDYGPTFLAGPAGAEPALVNWQYNAWGGKYPPFDADNAVAERIAARTGRRVFHGPLVLEGGAIDVNGAGLVLTTETCLLNPNRNPGVTKREVEEVLRAYLGVQRVLWLSGQIAGDDTDGHIDQLARFVDERTVVAMVEEDPADENYAPLRDNLTRLQSMTDLAGRPLRVVTLPMPRPKFFQHNRLPASYANFYVTARSVIVPALGDPADETARGTLARLFPSRKVQIAPALPGGGFGPRGTGPRHRVGARRVALLVTARTGVAAPLPWWRPSEARQP